VSSRQELIESGEQFKAIEIEIFERETQEYDLAKKQMEITNALSQMMGLINQKQ
jgi:hypothetical protein